MKAIKEQFLDDTHAQSNSRKFPPVRQFMPPEKVRGLEPETRMNQANVTAARAALQSHVGGASHRKASTHWKPENKDNTSTHVTTQLKNFFFKPEDLTTKPEVTVQRKTGPGTKDPKDLAKGEVFVYRNSEQSGVSFAKLESGASPEARSLVGFLEPDRREK